MQAGELFISSRSGKHLIRVTGRATFECAPALRNLAKTLEQETFSNIRIDLKDCQWMDSTFMGVLAMIGLRAKKIGAAVDICNAGKQNTDLLCGLGLKKLFRFVDDASISGQACETALPGTACTAPDAKTVLDAHETLMGVDEGNVKKFEGVVNMVRMDLDRQEKK